MWPRRRRRIFTGADFGFVAVLMVMAVLGVGPWLRSALDPVVSLVVTSVAHLDARSNEPVEWIEISVREHRLRLHQPDTEDVWEVPVAVGKPTTPTPIGEFAVIEMAEEPIWQNPFNPEVIYREHDPRNPLGRRWLGFKQAGLNDYGLHGTSDLTSIGHSVTNGCIRLRNADIIQLYDRVEAGTPVVIH